MHACAHCKARRAFTSRLVGDWAANNSFKPIPSRDIDHELLRCTCTRSPPRHVVPWRRRWAQFVFLVVLRSQIQILLMKGSFFILRWFVHCAQSTNKNPFVFFRITAAISKTHPELLRNSSTKLVSIKYFLSIHHKSIFLLDNYD